MAVIERKAGRPRLGQAGGEANPKLPGDQLQQPFVLGQPEEVVRTVGLAPGLIGSRQNPLSPRVRILTSGQVRRIAAMIRCKCFSEPAEASMSADRSLAQRS